MVCAALILVVCAMAAGVRAQQQDLSAAHQAYEKGEYERAISLLKGMAARNPHDGEVHFWLTKCYLEAKRYDEAVKSGENAVAANPQSSLYHFVLGEAYGQKADHASKLTAFGWARKTQKEFETAVQLDEHNYDAAQDLVDYDCTAPGIVGGGEDKAQPIIQKLIKMDAAEGHYAAAVCKADKKDAAGAEAEYTKALESKPKSAERLFEIGDYYAQHNNGDKVGAVAAQAQTLAPKDLRTKYYQAVGSILKGENHPDRTKLLSTYLQEAPVRSTYPPKWEAHYWLGRLYAMQKDTAKAKDEYHEALQLDPKAKKAQDALKRVEGN